MLELEKELKRGNEKKEQITFIQDILVHLNLDGFPDHTVFVNGDYSKIIIYAGPNELHDIRTRLKTCLGAWSDELKGLVNVIADRIHVDYEGTEHPIRITLVEDAKTIRLADYGMEDCALQQHTPEFHIQDKWTVSCPSEDPHA